MRPTIALLIIWLVVLTPVAAAETIPPALDNDPYRTEWGKIEKPTAEDFTRLQQPTVEDFNRLPTLEQDAYFLGTTAGVPTDAINAWKRVQDLQEKQRRLEIVTDYITKRTGATELSLDDAGRLAIVRDATGEILFTNGDNPIPLATNLPAGVTVKAAKGGGWTYVREGAETTVTGDAGTRARVNDDGTITLAPVGLAPGAVPIYGLTVSPSGASTITYTEPTYESRTLGRTPTPAARDGIITLTDSNGRITTFQFQDAAGMSISATDSGYTLQRREEEAIHITPGASTIAFYIEDSRGTFFIANGDASIRFDAGDTIQRGQQALRDVQFNKDGGSVAIFDWNSQDAKERRAALEAAGFQGLPESFYVLNNGQAGVRIWNADDKLPSTQTVSTNDKNIPTLIHFGNINVGEDRWKRFLSTMGKRIVETGDFETIRAAERGELDAWEKNALANRLGIGWLDTQVKNIEGRISAQDESVNAVVFNHPKQAHLGYLARADGNVEVKSRVGDVVLNNADAGYVQGLLSKEGVALQERLGIAGESFGEAKIHSLVGIKEYDPDAPNPASSAIVTKHYFDDKGEPFDVTTNYKTLTREEAASLNAALIVAAGPAGALIKPPYEEGMLWRGTDRAGRESLSGVRDAFESSKYTTDAIKPVSGRTTSVLEADVSLTGTSFKCASTDRCRYGSTPIGWNIEGEARAQLTHSYLAAVFGATPELQPIEGATISKGSTLWVGEDGQKRTITIDQGTVDYTKDGVVKISKARLTGAQELVGIYLPKDFQVTDDREYDIVIDKRTGTIEVTPLGTPSGRVEYAGKELISAFGTKKATYNWEDNAYEIEGTGKLADKVTLPPEVAQRLGIPAVDVKGQEFAFDLRKDEAEGLSYHPLRDPDGIVAFGRRAVLGIDIGKQQLEAAGLSDGVPSNPEELKKMRNLVGASENAILGASMSIEDPQRIARAYQRAGQLTSPEVLQALVEQTQKATIAGYTTQDIKIDDTHSVAGGGFFAADVRKDGGWRLALDSGEVDVEREEDGKQVKVARVRGIDALLAGRTETLPAAIQALVDNDPANNRQALAGARLVTKTGPTNIFEAITGEEIGLGSIIPGLRVAPADAYALVDPIALDLSFDDNANAESKTKVGVVIRDADIDAQTGTAALKTKGTSRMDILYTPPALDDPDPAKRDTLRVEVAKSNEIQVWGAEYINGVPVIDAATGQPVQQRKFTVTNAGATVSKATNDFQQFQFDLFGYDPSGNPITKAAASIVQQASKLTGAPDEDAVKPETISSVSQIIVGEQGLDLTEYGFQGFKLGPGTSGAFGFIRADIGQEIFTDSTGTKLTRPKVDDPRYDLEFTSGAITLEPGGRRDQRVDASVNKLRLLADDLGAKPGDAVQFRTASPGFAPRDAVQFRTKLDGQFAEVSVYRPDPATGQLTKVITTTKATVDIDSSEGLQKLVNGATAAFNRQVDTLVEVAKKASPGASIEKPLFEGTGIDLVLRDMGQFDLHAAGRLELPVQDNRIIAELDGRLAQVNDPNGQAVARLDVKGAEGKKSIQVLDSQGNEIFHADDLSLLSEGTAKDAETITQFINDDNNIRLAREKLQRAIDSGVTADAGLINIELKKGLIKNVKVAELDINNLPTTFDPRGVSGFNQLASELDGALRDRIAEGATISVDGKLNDVQVHANDGTFLGEGSFKYSAGKTHQTGQEVLEGMKLDVQQVGEGKINVMGLLTGCATCETPAGTKPATSARVTGTIINLEVGKGGALTGTASTNYQWDAQFDDTIAKVAGIARANIGSGNMRVTSDGNVEFRNERQQLKGWGEFKALADFLGNVVQGDVGFTKLNLEKGPPEKRTLIEAVTEDPNNPYGAYLQYQYHRDKKYIDVDRASGTFKLLAASGDSTPELKGQFSLDLLRGKVDLNTLSEGPSQVVNLRQLVKQVAFDEAKLTADINKGVIYGDGAAKLAAQAKDLKWDMAADEMFFGNSHFKYDEFTSEGIPAIRLSGGADAIRLDALSLKQQGALSIIQPRVVVEGARGMRSIALAEKITSDLTRLTPEQVENYKGFIIPGTDITVGQTELENLHLISGIESNRLPHGLIGRFFQPDTGLAIVEAKSGSFTIGDLGLNLGQDLRNVFRVETLEDAIANTIKASEGTLQVDIAAVNIERRAAFEKMAFEQVQKKRDAGEINSWEAAATYADLLSQARGSSREVLTGNVYVEPDKITSSELFWSAAGNAIENMFVGETPGETGLKLATHAASAASGLPAFKVFTSILFGSPSDPLDIYNGINALAFKGRVVNKYETEGYTGILAEERVGNPWVTTPFETYARATLEIRNAEEQKRSGPSLTSPSRALLNKLRKYEPLTREEHRIWRKNIERPQSLTAEERGALLRVMSKPQFSNAERQLMRDLTETDFIEKEEFGILSPYDRYVLRTLRELRKAEGNRELRRDIYIEEYSGEGKKVLVPEVPASPTTTRDTRGRR